MSKFDVTENQSTTTQYWGYRELSADELMSVGGGDDGDEADGGAGFDGVAEQGCMSADYGYSPGLNAQQAESLATSVGNITGGPVGALQGLAGNISTGVVGPSTGPSEPSGPSAQPGRGGIGGEPSYPGYGNPAGDPGPNYGF